MEGAGTAGPSPEGTEGHRIEAERKDERQQESQQQRQVIRWERFLPRRSLRVLLVENDDSTRHIVTALLRKCSYHVAAVADGLKAWDILKEKQYRFDLVLTEVEMPSLSGISLLSKITSCEQSRNIPVIMMSCQDSVNVVFKCMLEGAVDFLLKPVRRNELRNLWQHVWRKHCSTVNGVESVSNNQRKSEGMSGNNAAIKRATCADNGSKSRESCDEGGDTQSSGSKPMTRELRMQKHGEPIATELRNSSLEMDERLEKPNEGSVIPETASHKNDNRDEENELMRFRPETTPLVREVVLAEKHQGQGGFYDASACRDEHESYKEKSDGDLESHGSLEKLDVNLASPGSLSQGSVPSRPSKEINFIGSGANGDCSYASLDKNAHRDDFHCGVSRSPTDTNLATSDALSSWELSVRGPNLSGCSKEGFQGRLLLKPSAASAFSRYGTGVSISCQKSSSSPVSSCIANKNSSNHFQSNSGSSKEDAATIPSWRLKISQGNEAGTPICRQVSSASNEATDHLVACLREDVGVGHSSTKDNNHTMVFHPSLLGLMSLPFPMGGIPIQNLCAGYGSMLQPVFYSEPSQHNSTASGKAKDLASSDQLSPHGNRLINNISSQQNCHPYHLEQGGRNHTVDRATGDPRGSMCTEGEQSGPDDVCNQNFNSSGSNGSGGMTDGGVSAGMTTDGGSTSGFQNCNMKGLEWDRSRRETALIKFRLKRKDRCFEKKVRYHSWKKLAEQRPRVKGQFVRQFAT